MKKFKLLIASLALALGFLFCINIVSIGVKAEETEEIPDTIEVVEEAETSEDEADIFVDRLKDLKWDEAEAIIGWIIAYLVANAGIIISLSISLILKKTNEIKTSKAFKDALAKLTLEKQEETNRLIANFEEKLQNIYNENQKIIEEYNVKLQELSSDQTTEISQDLKKVAELLK